MGIFLKNILSEPSMAPMFCKYCPFCSLFYFYCFGLVNDSIAQQQGTGTANESLEHHGDDSIPHGA
jgi:hypothetical protein